MNTKNKSMDDIKILMLEDSAFDATIVERQLTRQRVSFTTHRVDEKKDFVNALKSFKPDVILSDHSINSFDSLSAFDIVKRQRPQAAFIVVTGNKSENFALTCMKKGVDDFVTKDELKRLSGAIKGSLDKKRYENELETVKDLKKEIKKRQRIIDDLKNEKDKFLSLISHEMINHVASMKSGLNLLEDATKKAGDKHWGYVKHLNESTDNVHKLLGNYMTINRMQHGVMQPCYTLVPFAPVVKHAMEKNEEAAARKGVVFCFSNLCGEARFKTDMSFVGIIADNLISNAVKYSRPGKEVSVKLYKEKGRHKLEVKDEGNGIPKHDMPKLYKRFEKLTPKPTAGEPSNGLGLSIVKELADAINAKIECKSTVGKGTTFTVSF